MKKAMLIVTIIFAAASAMAQSRLLGRRSKNRSQLLEPLLPFAEAVEKAKAENPQGYYALAIHYAKGEAIEKDNIKARRFLQKASNANYGNAILVYALLSELESVRKLERAIGQSKWILENHPCTRFEGYTSARETFFYDPSAEVMSLTNETHIANMCSNYIRAAHYGCSAATNELVRFERLSRDVLSDTKNKSDAAKQKAENAKLAEGLL